MSSQPAPCRMNVENVGTVSVVTFVGKRLVDENCVNIFGEELYRLVDELGRRKVLLKFDGIEFMAGAALGKLIALYRKLRAVQGSLVIYNVPKDIMDVFRITKIDRILAVAADPVVPG